MQPRQLFCPFQKLAAAAGGPLPPILAVFSFPTPMVGKQQVCASQGSSITTCYGLGSRSAPCWPPARTSLPRPHSQPQHCCPGRAHTHVLTSTLLQPNCPCPTSRPCVGSTCSQWLSLLKAGMNPKPVAPHLLGAVFSSLSPQSTQQQQHPALTRL